MGSTSYITDASGEVYQHLEYFAFGETFVEEHSNTHRTPYLFNGKELDEETGLYYYGARYYDARSSVWLAVDALTDKYTGVSPYAYVLNNPLKMIDPNGKDAVVTIQGNTITITSNIYIYGSGASAAQAKKMETAINKDWNNSGKGWTYTDVGKGKTYNVEIKASVQLYDSKDPTNEPFIIPDSWDPSSTNNYIEVSASAKDFNNGGVSFVRGGDEGQWRGYGTDPSSHEFGHILGLDDQYTKTGAKPGWSGNIMAEPAGRGSVQQKNIDDLINPLMGDYNDYMNDRRERIEANKQLFGYGIPYQNKVPPEKYQTKIDP